MNENRNLPSVEEVLASPSSSHWLKNALHGALDRDVLDASGDADLLASILNERMEKAMGASLARMAAASREPLMMKPEAEVRKVADGYREMVARNETRAEGGAR